MEHNARVLDSLDASHVTWRQHIMIDCPTFYRLELTYRSKIEHGTVRTPLHFSFRWEVNLLKMNHDEPIKASDTAPRVKIQWFYHAMGLHTPADADYVISTIVGGT